ncbi:MAG: HEAT repeat domain-containing protein, partial [Chloroflexota bacterium]
MIQDTLQKIADAPSAPPAVEVARLAGLSASDRQAFLPIWRGIPPERRQAVLRLAIQLAENDVELDFTDVFKACLSDPNEGVRAAAIEGLWEDEDFRTADVLAGLVRTDPAEQVRAVAALGLSRFAVLAELGKLYGPSADRVKAALLASATDRAEASGVRRRAIEAVGAFSDPIVGELVAAAYADPDPAMRASAVYAMGRTCDDRWLETILRELENENPELRYEAARAAGGIESSRALVPLITLLDDVDLEVRLASIGAIAEIGGEIARKTLEQCARSDDAAIRAAALDALNDLGLNADPLSIS